MNLLQLLSVPGDLILETLWYYAGELCCYLLFDYRVDLFQHTSLNYLAVSHHLLPLMSVINLLNV